MCNRVVRKTQIALCNSIVYVPKQLTVPHNFLMLDRTQTIEHSIKYMAIPVTFKIKGRTLDNYTFIDTFSFIYNVIR
jgi:hypothetical protein